MHYLVYLYVPSGVFIWIFIESLVTSVRCVSLGEVLSRRITVWSFAFLSTSSHFCLVKVYLLELSSVLWSLGFSCVSPWPR